MVWKNAREGLYSAVERNNAGVDAPHNRAPEKPPCGNAPRDRTPEKPPCGNAPRDRAPEKPPCGNAPQRCTYPPDPLRALMSDRDALILVALIILLVHEKADMKLILALAFVLLA